MLFNQALEALTSDMRILLMGGPCEPMNAVGPTVPVDERSEGVRVSDLADSGETNIGPVYALSL